jgi:hypothetical protein
LSCTGRYLSVAEIANRVDATNGPRVDINDPFLELYQKDFIFAAAMQTARRLGERQMSLGQGTSPDRVKDRVLDRLLEEGIFDRNPPDVPHVAEEAAMRLAAAIGNCLLDRIILLEAEVGDLSYGVTSAD